MAPGGSNKRSCPSQPTPAPLSKRQHRADDEDTAFVARHDSGIWKDAPVLTGSTKFEPLADCKNILVTGGAGFIACWVVRHLALTYPSHYNIISFDKLDYCASLNNTGCLSACPNFTFVHGDITSPLAVQSVLKKYSIDTVFHFAAQSHVDLSFGNSYEFTSTNVYGTHVLLDCAKNCGTLKRFIHVSTDEVYGEVAAGSADCTESSLLAPTNPYAASKAAAEMLVHSYWKSFKLPVIIVRSNNIYGPHQFPEKVIPKFTLALARRLPLLLHGDGLHTRRYLFASDATDAFDTILHRGVIGATYNVGSADEISNLQLCSQLLQHFGYDTTAPGFTLADHVRHTADRPFNDRRYAVDATRLCELGWRQKVRFVDGLRRTVVWYRRYGERWWGDVTKVVEGAFPVVSGGVVVSDGEEGVVSELAAENKEKTPDEKPKPKPKSKSKPKPKQRENGAEKNGGGGSVEPKNTDAKRNAGEEKKSCAKGEIDGARRKSEKKSGFIVGDEGNASKTRIHV